MADVSVTLRIMPESPDTDLSMLFDSVANLIQGFGGTVHSTEQNPIAFGLKALDILFIMPEEKGSTEPLEKRISEIDGVSSVDVIDVRRAVG